MKRILIVDDEKEVRAVFKMALERAGYEVQVAEDGEDGLRYFRESPADLMIVDIIMPEKDGIETIAEIRKESPGIKILAVSGGGRICSDEYLKIAKTLGATRTMEKPVTREQLLDTVQQMLA